MQRFIANGNLCKDVDLKTTTGGKSYLVNSIAVRNDFKNSEGNYDSEFFNIVVWGKTAEYLSNYAGKGTKVLIEGRLTNRSYDKSDGSTGYITEIVCSSVEIISGKKQEETTEKEITEYSGIDPYKEFGDTIEINDLDLPFE